MDNLSAVIISVSIVVGGLCCIAIGIHWILSGHIPTNRSADLVDDTSEDEDSRNRRWVSGVVIAVYGGACITILGIISLLRFWDPE